MITKLELTQDEFTLVRLAVAMELDKLAKKDVESLKTLIRKFTEELKKCQS